MLSWPDAFALVMPILGLLALVAFMIYRTTRDEKEED